MSTAPRTPVPTLELPRRRVLLIIGALMLGTFLAALDQTIVATALPTIVGLTELAGLQLDPRSHARLLRLGLAFIRLVGQGGEMIVRC